MNMLEMEPVFWLFAAFMIIILFAYLGSRMYAKGRPSPAKRVIYACGEDMKPEPMQIPEESFYAVFIKAMGLEKIKEWHNGDLTRYLLWMFAGMVLLMLCLLLW